MKKQLTTLLCGSALALSLSIPLTPIHAAPSALAAPLGHANTLAGTQWELTSPPYAGLEEKPTLRFDESGLGASVGLNRMGGDYKTDGRKLTVSPLFSTRMAGPPAVMNAENRYKSALEGARSFELARDGKKLTLKGKQNLIFVHVGQTIKNPLALTQWALTSPIYEGLKEKPMLNFSKDSLGASVGLNVMGAGYRVDGNSIQLEQFISTMMAGPPAVMNAEEQYKKALGNVQTFELAPDGKTLTLRGRTFDMGPEGKTLKLRSESLLTFASIGTAPQGFGASETKILNVAPQLGPEINGDQTPKYLQLEDLGDDGWNTSGWGQFSAAKIEGFEFVPDYRYRLRVLVERDAQSGEKRLSLLENIGQLYTGTAQPGANDIILEIAPTQGELRRRGPDEVPASAQSRRQMGEFSCPHWRLRVRRRFSLSPAGDDQQNREPSRRLFRHPLSTGACINQETGILISSRNFARPAPIADNLNLR